MKPHQNYYHIPKRQAEKAITIATFIFLLMLFRIIKLENEPIHILSPLAGGAVEIVREIPMITLTIDNYIAEASNKYHINRDYLHCLIRHESSYNPQAISDNGKAVGLFQFWPGTWIGYRKRMGADTNPELRKNPKEAIFTAAYVLSVGGDHNWDAQLLTGNCKRD